MKRIYRLLLLIGVFVPGLIQGQESPSWTLEKCIEQALIYNRDINRVGIEVQKKEISIKENRTRLLPSLAINTNGTYSIGRVLDQTTYEFLKSSTVGYNSSSFNGSLTLFDGNKRLYAIKQSKIDLKASEAKVLSVKKEVINNVISSYLTLQCYILDLQCAKEICELLEEQMEVIKALVEEGIKTETDLLQIRSQVFSAQNDISLSEWKIDSETLRLCQLIGFKQVSSFSITGIPLTESSLPEAYMPEDITVDPDYQFASQQIKVQQYNLKIAKASIMPTISLNAGLGTSYSSARRQASSSINGETVYSPYPFWEQYRDNSNAFITISISIPVFNRLSYYHSVKKNVLSLEEAELELDQTKERIEQRNAQCILDCRAALVRFNSSIEHLKYTEMAEKQLRERYFVGETDYYTWSTAAIEYAKSKYDLIENQFRYYYSINVLKLYMNEEYLVK